MCTSTTRIDAADRLFRNSAKIEAIKGLLDADYDRIEHCTGGAVHILNDVIDDLLDIAGQLQETQEAEHG